MGKELGISQSRLSEIERGQGSFTAEQFLTILRAFNVPATHFVDGRHGDDYADLQNALARLGAIELRESGDVLPSERMADVNSVVREALLAGRPRLIVALAPVIVLNIDKVNLKKLYFQLADTGHESRIAWLVENIVTAIDSFNLSSLSRELRRRYGRATVVLNSFLESTTKPDPSPQIVGVASQDLLDGDIRSKQSLQKALASSSVISKRWGIVTELRPGDFGEALKGLHVI